MRAGLNPESIHQWEVNWNALTDQERHQVKRLLLSAYSAPVIMMSQNRQASKDRLSAEIDYRINLHAEAEIVGIRIVRDDLVGNQWAALMEMQSEQLRLLAKIEVLTTEVRNLRRA